MVLGNLPADRRPRTPVQSPLAVALTVLFVILAMGAVALATKQGIGTSPDSGVYLAVSRSIAAGRGVVDPRTGPLTHFPPGYPAALALADQLNPESLEGARWLNMVLFGTLLVILGAIARGAAGSTWAACLVVALTATAPRVLRLGMMMWSEPLALVLAFGALAVLIRALELDSTPHAAAAGVLIGASVLTRYAFLAFWIAATACIIGWSPWSRARRARHALVLAAATWVVLGAWLVRDVIVGSRATDRRLAWHPISWAELQHGAEVVGTWVLTVPALRIVAAAAGAAALAALIVVAARSRHAASPAMWVVCVSACVYVAAVVASISLVDADTPLDQRILAPLFMCLALVVSVLVARARRWREWTALMVLILGVKSGVTWYFVADAARSGIGYSSVAWRRSPLIAQLPIDGVVYSTDPQAHYILSGRVVEELPRKWDWNHRANADYASRLAAIGHEAARETVYIAYFTPSLGATGQPSRAELARASSLDVVLATANGTLYRVSNGGFRGGTTATTR